MGFRYMLEDFNEDGTFKYDHLYKSPPAAKRLRDWLKSVEEDDCVSSFPLAKPAEG